MYSEIKSFLSKSSKMYDYILVDSGNFDNYKIKRFIMQISKVKIKVINPNILGIKEIERNKGNKEIKEPINRKGLHIIYNKYCFNLVSSLVLEKYFKNVKDIYTIFYQKEFINLSEKIQKSENIKLKNNIKIQLEKIVDK